MKPGRRKLQEIPIASITVAEDRRGLRDIHDLAESIAKIGLLNPITVTPSLNLVAGMHRLEACKSLEWSTIPAIVVDLEGLHAALGEIDENLIRHDLTELERAQNLKRRKEIYEALYPETRPVTVRGGPGRGNGGARESTVLPFARDVASKLGVGDRTVRRSIEIAEGLDPQAAEALRQSPIANRKNDLVRLAKMDPDVQRGVAQLLGTGNAVNMKGALQQLRWGRLKHAGTAPAKGKHYRLFAGDFAIATAKIDPESVNLAVADPPWSRAFAARLGELASVCSELLVQGGYALLFIGQEYLPQVFAAFAGKLDYRWTLCLRQRHPKQDWRGGVLSAWVPIVVFQRGKSTRKLDFRWDTLEDDAQEAKADPWQKGEHVYRELIDRYSHPEDRVVDLFCGSGTAGVASIRLGRHFSGFDIEPAAIKATAARISKAKWADPQARPKPSGRLAYPV